MWLNSPTWSAGPARSGLMWADADVTEFASLVSIKEPALGRYRGRVVVILAWDVLFIRSPIVEPTHLPNPLFCLGFRQELIKGFDHSTQTPTGLSRQDDASVFGVEIR